jgi:hypothetical protein
VHAFVTLVFKGGDPSDVSSYRPILLTCVASKIMDCSIVTDILAHLCVHNVIERRQLDFLSGHSTSMNLLESLNNWTLAIKDGKSVLVAYIDYSTGLPTLPIFAEASRFLCSFPRLRFFFSKLRFFNKSDIKFFSIAL